MTVGWLIRSGEVWLGAFEAVSSHWKEMHLLMCSSFGKGIFNRLPSRKCWIGPNKFTLFPSLFRTCFKCYSLFLEHSFPCPHLCPWMVSVKLSVPRFEDALPSKTFLVPQVWVLPLPNQTCVCSPIHSKAGCWNKIVEKWSAALLQVLRASLWLSW